MSTVYKLTNSSFTETGTKYFPHALSVSEINILAALFAANPFTAPGKRVFSDRNLSSLLEPSTSISRIVKSKLGISARPVRAMLFDKNKDTNWALGWHQDRTIAVRDQRDVAGFGPWSKKAGVNHVEPPFKIIERMVTLRVHLDSCPTDNAPLVIALGSHRIGRIPVDAIEDIVRDLQTMECLAQPGDIWMYATAILHASSAATRPERRRVLQIDFAHEELPSGLCWLGIGE